MPLMNATGYWTAGDYGSTPEYNSGAKEEVKIVSTHDKKVLRDLAKKVYEIACSQVQEQKRKLWLEHNSLKPTKPLIICDPENGWNEIITECQLACNSSLAKRWEMVLKKEIFWGTKLLDDKPIETNFDIGYSYSESSWGEEVKFHGGIKGGSYVWEPILTNINDLGKIKFPLLDIDYMTTNKIKEIALEIFEGILNVRTIGKWWWSTGLTYELVLLRGMEKNMIDMVESPNFVQELMNFLKENMVKRIKYLEKNGLLSLNNDLYLSPGGFGYTNELPKKDFKSKVRTIDLWGYSESQETVGVSPKMFEELIFPYQLEIQNLFGLNSYGCCEPLDQRWGIIKNIPRLRKVSVSPWADLKKMADSLEDKYCYCLKPNPSYLAVKEIDQNLIKKTLKTAFDITKNCRVEVLMQDNHTIGNNPNNVVQWVKIAKEEAEKSFYN